MMGTGKSTAGRVAARELSVPFFDTDEVIAKETGATIPEYWTEHGEQGFRIAESAAVKSLATAQGIKATGGGVVLDPSNRAILTSGEQVVWLTGSPETLRRRLASHEDRPLVAMVDEPVESTLAILIAERELLYAEVCTHRVDTDGRTAEEVAGEVVGIWKT